MTVAGRIAVLLLLLGLTPSVGAVERSLDYWRVGNLALYLPAANPSRLVLLISGAKGPQEPDVAAARALAAAGALVVGIDGPAYLQAVGARHDKRGDACVALADDFDAAARFVEKDAGFTDYVEPVLVGLDEGAALAYAVLAQAPARTFRGAVGVGFCPVVVSSRPLCPGNALHADAPASGTVRLRPTGTLASRWMSLPRVGQPPCDPHALDEFARAGMAQVPAIAQGAPAPAASQSWASLIEAVAALSAPPKGDADQSSGSVDDLPLVEVRSAAGTPASDLFAVLVSGDGGWAGIDKNIARYLSERGIPVVGVDALRYLWARKTPPVVAADLERLLRRYLAIWGKQRVLLIGYSLGAEAALVMAEGLPPDLKRRLALLALLGPAPDTDLEVHVGEWFGASEDGDYPLAPVAARLGEVPLLCVHSEREKAESLCPRLGTAIVVPLPGNHHFDDDYERVGATILDHVR